MRNFFQLPGVVFANTLFVVFADIIIFFKYRVLCYLVNGNGIV